MIDARVLADERRVQTILGECLKGEKRLIFSKVLKKSGIRGETNVLILLAEFLIPPKSTVFVMLSDPYMSVARQYRHGFRGLYWKGIIQKLTGVV